MATLVLAYAAGAACAPSVLLGTRRSPAELLSHTIDSIIASPPLHRTHWGILVHDQGTRRVIYRTNAERHFIPASNTKLVVSIVAFGTLGPDYRFETPLYAQATPGDTIAERLILVGSGDPTLSARFRANEFVALDSLAEAVALSGIRHTNELVIDASRFDVVRVNPTWEVGDLPATSAPPVGAFALAEGTFAIERGPGTSPGEPAHVAVLGGDALQPLATNVRTDTAGARTVLNVDYLSRRDSVFLTGAVAADARLDTVRYSVTDPIAYAGRALEAALRARGVHNGSLRIVRESAEARVLRDTARTRMVSRLVSPPLSSIIAAILQPSQNWIAEQLLLSLGAHEHGLGSWSTGIASERRYLVDVVGLDSLAFLLRDASGLSAQNLLTPDATVRLLEHAQAAPWGAQFRAALAAPRLRGSTLANRLETLEGRLAAKTGTITNVNSLSGYVMTRSGRELTFAILTNASGVPSSTVRQAIDAIVQAIAQFGDSP